MKPDAAMPHERGETGAVDPGSGVRSRDQILQEIERLRLMTTAPKTISTLEWVLGIYPLSPTERIVASRWQRLVDEDNARRTERQYREEVGK